jgi:hypothetical protein
MANLPDFITSNTPVSKDDRISWAKGIAPAYAGIMLWYAFWQALVNLGNANDASAAILSQGVGVALAALAAAAAICFIFFYYVPGMLGMTTGRPLSVVGTSVFGARGGFILPGFLMGLLQFGWLSVNATFASILLWQCFKGDFNTEFTVIVQDKLFWGIAVAFIILAVFMAYKGMKLVGFIGQYAVLVPIAAMILLLIPTFKGVQNFKPDMIGAAAAVEKEVPAAEAPVEPAAGQDAASTAEQVVADVKADAAAVAEEVKTSAQDAAAAVKEDAAAVAEEVKTAAQDAAAAVKEDAAAVAEEVKTAAQDAAAAVKEGAAKVEEAAAAAPAEPMTTLAIFLGVIAYITGFFATAGAAGVDISSNARSKSDVIWGGFFGIFVATFIAGAAAIFTVAGAYGAGLPGITGNNPVAMISALWGPKVALVCNVLLVISAFPAACVSSLIGIASLKSTLSKIPPFISVGLCTLAAIGICLMGWGLDAGSIFGFIGASFGPVCGAMMAEYILTGGKWTGPRAGFSPAGWLAWLLGFIVGNWNVHFASLNWNGFDGLTGFTMPCTPMSAFIVGFVVYMIFSWARTSVIELETEKE